MATSALNERPSGRQSRYVTTTVPLDPIVTLPIAAREILSDVCKKALEQQRRVA